MVSRTAERRPLGALGRMGIVAAMHVAVLFVIARSVGIGSKPAEPPPFVGTVINEPQPIEEPPPTIDEKRFLERETLVTPFDPPPPLAFEQDPPITLQPEEGPVIPRTGEVVDGPVLVDVRPDSRYPLTRPTYPARMIREGKAGSADVEIYVLPTGRVSDARIIRSSGFEELDQSTLAEAKRKWRLLPATRDGVPIAQWHRLRVTFKLNQQ
jgi:protein TonB